MSTSVHDFSTRRLWRAVPRWSVILVLLAVGCGKKSPEVPQTQTAEPPAAGGTDAQAGSATSLPATASGPDLTWLADDVEMVVQVRLAEILNSPLVKQLSGGGTALEAATIDADLKLHVGDVELMTVGVRKLSELDSEAVQQGPSGFDPAKHFLMSVLRLSQPLDRSLIETDAEMQPVEHAGKTYYRRDADALGDPDVALFLADDTTLVLGAEPEIRAALERGPGRPSSERFSYMNGDAHLVVAFALQDLTPLRTAPIADAAPTEWAAAVRAIQQHGEHLGLQVSLTDGAEIALRARCESPAGAAEVAEKLNVAAQSLQAAVQQNREGLMFLMGIVGPLVNSLSGSADGSVAELSTKLPADAGEVLAGVAPMLGMMIGAQAGQMMMGQGQMMSGPGGMPFAQRRVEDLLAISQPASTLEGLADGTTLMAAVSWETGDGPLLPGEIEQPPNLKVHLIAQGGSAARAIAFGRLRLSRAATDVGRLKQVESNVMIDSAREMNFLDRDEPWLPTPADGLVLLPTFGFPADQPTAIEELAGTFQLRLSEQQTPKMLANLNAVIETPVDDPDLQAAGLTVRLEEPPFEGLPEAMLLRVNRTAALGDLEVFDRDGNPLTDVWTDRALLNDGSSRYRITSGVMEKLPEGMQLRFTLHTGLQDVTARFRFDDLPIPPLEQPVTDEQKALAVWTPSTVTEGLPTGTFVEGRAGWSTMTNFDTQGNELPRALEVTVDVTGEVPLRTIAFGRCQIETAQAGDAELEVNRNGFGLFQSSLEQILLYDPLYASPPDGARFSLEFVAPETPPTVLDEVSGRATLITAASQQYLDLPDVLPLLDQELEHPALQAAGIKLVLTRAGDTISVKQTAANPFAVTAIDAIDSTGAELMSVYSGRADFDGSVEFSLLTDDEFPSEMGLRITLNEGVEEHVVPFRFEKMPVPAPPPVE